jgi:PST family polysaccharide transporter
MENNRLDGNQVSPSNRTRSKLIGNMLWLYALQGLNYLVPLAVLPYLVRVLGVERYGLVAFAQAFAQGFIFLTDYGFNLSATREFARLQRDHKEVPRIFWSVMTIKLALMFIGALVLATLIAVVPRLRSDAAVYVIAYAAVVGSVLFPVLLFQGMEQMRYISVVSGGAKLVAAVLLFVFVRSPSDYLLALSIQSGGLLVAGIAGFWVALARFRISYRCPSREEIWQMLRDGWHLFVSTAAGTLYATSNVFLVGLIAGNVQAGYFSAAEKTVRGVQGLLTPTTLAIYPHVSGLATESRDRAVAFIRKALVWMGLLSLIPSLVLLVFARPIALLLFGGAAAGSVAPLRCIALLPFILSLSSVLAIQTMIPFGMERQLSRIYVVAGIGSLAFSLPVIRQFGAVGAGGVVMVVETCVVVALWGVLAKHGVDLLSPPGLNDRGVSEVKAFSEPRVV